LERAVEINVQDESEIPSIVRHIVEQDGSVYHVSARSLSLEEIYFSLLESHKSKKENL
jgi:hypothetical protein